MRIQSVEIEGFRSIRHLECNFESVTTLVGPNGAGKSNILRALDWFFNGDASQLTEEDVFQGSGDARIRVRVDFTDLTKGDRDALGNRYCPEGAPDAFTVWRTWANGADKVTARALAYRPFEEIRRAGAAMDKRRRYNDLRSDHAELGLPHCASAAAVDDAMDAWEREHPEKLEAAEISDTHFFGVTGRSRLGNLFDFVFVSADLRTSDATSSERRSILSRILQRAVDRTKLDEAALTLVETFTADLQKLSDDHLGDQLKDLSGQLSAEVSAFTQGRSIALRETISPARPVSSSVAVLVQGRGAETAPEHQGHGFQRTLLLAALTVLSRSKSAGAGSGQMFLAIEEPELYQHPTQTKAFASVLRELANLDGSTTQVAYATHNHHFVHPAYFDQVRRVSNPVTTKRDPMGTQLASASMSAVMDRLDGFVPTISVQRRWEQVCLKYLPEALFAESVILVEGEEDAAVLEGMGERNDLAIEGICVAPVSGKANMMIPAAILELLGIQTLMVVDNDSGKAERMRTAGKEEGVIDQAETATRTENRALCRFVGEREEDYPTGAVGGRLAFVPDTLETLLASELPGWDLTRRRLIDEGRGVEGKNAATYALTSRECQDEPGADLAEILELCSRKSA